MKKEQYILEAIRNIGVGLIVAGVIGLLFHQTSTLNGAIAIFYGCTSVILGLTLIKE